MGETVLRLYAAPLVEAPINPTIAPVRSPKSEHEEATLAIEEVGPNILRLRLPIHLPGLAHINTYALVDKNGAAIVDPGLPGPSSWRDLKKRLALAEIPIKRVHTILITHSHPDHFGNAGLLAHESGAKLLTHRAFRTWWSPNHQCTVDDCADPGHDHPETGQEPLPPGIGDRFGKQLPWSPELWSPGMKTPIVRRTMTRVGLGRLAGRLMRAPTPSERLRDNQSHTLAGREWFAVHTPGHTLDHLCLYDPEGGTFISGDHVLPTITPHVGGIGNGSDPLRSFFDSLRKVGALPHVNTVLPAHGKVFNDLHGRAEEIVEHHAERLGRLMEAVIAEGPATVEAMSHHLFRQERWGHMAQSETYTHLEYLAREGKLHRADSDGMATYQVA